MRSQGLESLKNAKEIEVRGNKQLRLDNRDKVWLVKSGKVDVFAVRTQNNEPYGYRSNIMRFEKDELIFSVEAENIMFIALGTPETVCYEIEKDVFSKEAEKKKLIEAIDNWVSKLSDAISQTLRPKVTGEIDIIKDFEIGKDKNFSAKEENLWMELKKGRIRYLDLLEFEKGFIPLTKKTWISSLEDSLVNTLTTSDLLDNPAFGDIFLDFNRAATSLISEKINKTEKNEIERLKNKALNKEKILNLSIDRIRRVLTPPKGKIDTSAVAGASLLNACKIVGNYLNIKISPHPEDNTILENIMRASKIRSRKVILKDNWWEGDSGPLLCFYKEDKTPVPVVPLSPTTYEVIDLKNNKRERVDGKISEDLEPFAYTFYRPFPEKQLTGWDLLKFGMFNSGIDITVVILMGIFGALLGLLTPIFTGIIFNSVIPEAATGQLFQMAFILVSCAIATLLFELTKATAMLRVEGKADYSLQSAVWDRLMALPPSFFRNYSSGDLAMRSMGIDGIRQIISGVTVQSILSFIFSVFYWGLLFYYNFWLAVIGTLLGVALLITTFSIGYVCVRYQRKITEIDNKLSGLVLQFLSGVPKLRITGAEINAFSLWAKDFAEQKEYEKKLGVTQNIIKTFNSMFPALSMICIFSWVVFKINEGLTTGDFLAFNSAYSSFQNGLLQMSLALVTSLNVVPLYNNLKPILQTMPEVSEAKEHPGELTGDIEVSHVDFRYTKDGPLILKDVSIKINQDQFVAIVGGSGSGKSTLFRLLLGFETPEKGYIFYNGKDLDTLDIIEVRKQLGVVLQNAKMLQGSIFENIVGSSNLTLDDAWQAVKMSGCFDDINNMPMKMHTIVPPGGGTLSGGQRQRVIIARSLVKKPRILFFDEATSALDNKTQSIVTESLEKMKVTRVVIAHRISTIKNADIIYCFDRGVILEQGNYDELMEKKGFFYELARRQIA